MNYSILITTRKRPQLLIGLVQSIYDTVENKDNTEIHITYDLDDDSTKQIISHIKETYRYIKIEFHGRMRSTNINNDYYNWAATNFATGKYIIAVNDDAKFIKCAWDNIATKKIEDYLMDKPDGIFYGITQDREVEKNRNEQNYFSCFPLISNAGINALGFLFDPMFYRDAADWDIVMVYKGINRILDLRNEIIIEHISVRSGRREKDELDYDVINYPNYPKDGSEIGKNTKEYINFLTDYIHNYGTDKYKEISWTSKNTNAKNIVTEIYRYILKRDPDPERFDHYVTLISSGKLTKEELAETIRNSKEYNKRFGDKMSDIENIKNVVNEGYRDILKRDPDPGGFKHHVEYISSRKLTKEQFLEVLRNSEEYKIKNVVIEGYRDILKRDPISEELEGYTDNISSRKLTKDQFLEVLRNSETKEPKIEETKEPKIEETKEPKMYKVQLIYTDQ